MPRSRDVSDNSPRRRTISPRNKRSISRSRSYSRSPSSRRSRSNSYSSPDDRKRSGYDSPRDDRRREYGSPRDDRRRSGDSYPRYRVKRFDRNHVPEPCKCVGVFGLSVYTTEHELRDTFRKCGPIDNVTVIKDRASNRSRGFGFILFRHQEDADEALHRYNGIELDGRQIRVDYSVTKRPHSPTPGVYMGKPYNTDTYKRSRDYRRSYDDDDEGYDRRRRSRSSSDHGGRYTRRSRSRSRSYERRR